MAGWRLKFTACAKKSDNPLELARLEGSLWTVYQQRDRFVVPYLMQRYSIPVTAETGIGIEESSAMPMLIQLGVWTSASDDYFVTHDFSDKAIRLLLDLEKTAQGMSVNLDEKVRDYERLDWIKTAVHLQPTEDQETSAPARPPIGASGRIEPINALAKRVMGSPQKI